MDTSRVVSDWCARDEARGLFPVDREIVLGTTAARTNIVEHVLRGGPHADLFHACAILGRLIASRGGSPTLAASTMDGLVEALGESKDGDERGTPWIVSARASLAEGFAAAQRETARAEALLSLEYPQCAIPLEAGSIALVASFPDDDGEVRNAWAARVANAAARGGVRRATVGDGVARAALVDALSIAGIEVRPVNEPRPSRSFRLPWQRR